MSFREWASGRKSGNEDDEGFDAEAVLATPLRVSGEGASEAPPQAAPATAEPDEVRREPATIPVAVDDPPAAVNVEGGATIAPNATVHEAVYVSGSLRVGRDARVAGAVTAMGDAAVGDGARLDDGLEVHGVLHWGRGASAARARAHGAFVTADGRVRATSLTARRGIHSGRPDAEAKEVVRA